MHHVMEITETFHVVILSVLTTNVSDYMFVATPAAAAAACCCCCCSMLLLLLLVLVAAAAAAAAGVGQNM